MKIGFIGCGNMGSALATAISKKIGGENILLCDHTEAKAIKLASSFNGSNSDAKTIWEECDYVFFAVKPQVLEKTVKDTVTGSKRKTRPVAVTMAAGVSIETFRSFFGFELPVIRIMPNTPTAVGKGITLICHDGTVDKKIVDNFTDFMSESGMVSVIDEKLIDAASAVTGCGPAFVYMFIDALADGAVSCGLPRAKAIEFAAQTLIGSAEMVLKTGEHPDKLKDNVCSPKGSTIAGVRALEEKSFRAAAFDAVVASYNRTLELGKK